MTVGRTVTINTNNGLVEFSEVPTTKPQIQVTISDHDDAGIVVLSLTEARHMVHILTMLIDELGPHDNRDNLPQGDMA